MSAATRRKKSPLIRLNGKKKTRIPARGKGKKETPRFSNMPSNRKSSFESSSRFGIPVPVMARKKKKEGHPHKVGRPNQGKKEKKKQEGSSLRSRPLDQPGS